MRKKICKSKKFKSCPIGSVKKIETKKGREVTIERTKPHGKNKKLIGKIISNKEITK
jgi:hypothetical protein